MRVCELIEKLKELNVNDMEVKAPGLPPNLPSEWFTGGIIDVCISSGPGASVVLVPDMSG